MIFKLNSEGFILNWDKATLEEKDAMIKAIELARTAYIRNSENNKEFRRC